MGIKWIQTIRTPVSHNSKEVAQTKIKDLKDMDWIVDGVSFMKAAIPHVEQQRRAKAVLGGKFVNTNICHCGAGTTPSVAFHTKLAVKMGWIVASSDHTSGFKLGPNLQQEFLGDQVPDMKSRSAWNDLDDEDSNPTFQAVRVKTYLDLSVSCSWRFTNLNTAFRSIVGGTHPFVARVLGCRGQYRRGESSDRFVARSHVPTKRTRQRVL